MYICWHTLEWPRVARIFFFLLYFSIWNHKGVGWVATRTFVRIARSIINAISGQTLWKNSLKMGIVHKLLFFDQSFFVIFRFTIPALLFLLYTLFEKVILLQRQAYIHMYCTERTNEFWRGHVSFFLLQSTKIETSLPKSLICSYEEMRKNNFASV